MTKTSFLDFRIQTAFIKKSLKSRWFPFLVFIPLVIYGIYVLLEDQLVSFIISLFPVEKDKSYFFYSDFLHIIFTELLWLSAFFMLAWILVIYAPLPQWFHKSEYVLRSRANVFAAAVIAISFVLSLYVSNTTLETFPNSSDEYAYLYQAKTLGDSKLWEFAHDQPDFFYFNHIANKDGISVSRFPPGWPLLLSTAYFFNFNPALVNPVLGLLTLVLFYSFTKRFYSWRVAFWSLVSVALTSFFIFNAASYFSHTSCALFAVAFVYGTYLYLDTGRPIYAILAGLSIGLVLITRYYTALLIFLPFFFYIFYRLKLKSFAAFIWIGVGSIPCVLFLFWYNNAITGNPLLPVTMWAYSDEALGFVRGHSVTKGLEHLVRWSAMFLYWCTPALFILYVVGLIQKFSSKADRWVRPEDYFYLLLMAGYFFYYQIGGNQYGPRFFFEAFPFLVVFVVNRMFQLRAKWAMALFTAGIIYAVVKFPFIAEREHRVIGERNDLYNAVQINKIHNAVVFISAYTSVIRPMPIGDLTRNDVDYMNDVLYAIDLKERNNELMDYYPDRAFYKYVRHTDEVHGKLIKIR
jgi:hypothetical protein